MASKSQPPSSKSANFIAEVFFRHRLYFKTMKIMFRPVRFVVLHTKQCVKLDCYHDCSSYATEYDPFCCAALLHWWFYASDDFDNEWVIHFTDYPDHSESVQINSETISCTYESNPLSAIIGLCKIKLNAI